MEDSTFVKINVLGGGPGGLYASLLIKQAYPDWQITVFERNPEGATYGWGVVFSDATLAALREADLKTYEQITDAFVRWDAIDVYYKDELLRCGGHVFAGIARVDLLNILQARCEALDIDIHFEVEVDDPTALAGEADVFIAADGVNSLTRPTYAEHFQPSVAEGDARFIWFGTDKPFDAFTFIFRENEHGLFTVHAYPFDGTTSTFIVECRPETWHSAGLDEATEEESLAYCETLFADHLGQYRLLSNFSRWLTFNTVKNRNWHYENVVLLGDAAHTAHFSIGSGTKIAMEDAIALAEGFAAHGEDYDAAFNDYELARKPRVDGLQEAAAESQAYFEHVARYTQLDPLQFTFHLLTRSGRISYDNLRLRDAYFVSDVDRWFAGVSTERESPIVAPPPMFMPLHLRRVTMSNRVVLAPRPRYTARDGVLAEDQSRRLRAPAHGDVGMVLTEPVAISADGRITPGCPGLYTESHARAWHEVVEEIHAASNTKMAVQLNHAGRRGATRPRSRGLDRPLADGGWPLLAPSAIPYLPDGPVPRAMDREDMDQVRADFVHAAELAEQAGVDVLLLHFGHGYLLAGFLSPLTNHREDEYGGSLQNRLRYPLEVFEAVRGAWPDDRPLGVTLSASDWAAGGNDVEEAFAIARRLREHGCDLFAVVAGQTVLAERPDYDTRTLGRLSEWVRNEVGVPTMSTSYITTEDEVNTLVAGGRADLCVMYPPGVA